MIVLFIVLLLAVLFDFKSYRIPNKLILFGILTGILYHIFWPKENIIFYLIGFISIILIGLPIFQLHIIGAGDIKLLAVCSLFWGYQHTYHMICIAFILGAIYSFFALIHHYLLSYSSFKRESVNQTFIEYIKTKPTKKLHFSLFILLANLAEIVLIFKS